MEQVSGANLTITARIASWSARHHRLVLTASLAVFILAVLAIVMVGSETRDDDEGVGESGKASELLRERFRSEPSPAKSRQPARTERIIFSNPSLDVDDSTFRSTVQAIVDELRDSPHVESVVSFYDTGDSGMVADDRNAVLAVVNLQNPPGVTRRHIEIGPLLDAVDEASRGASGFEVEVFSFGLNDDQIEEILDEDFARILLISMVIGLIILLIAFKALVAAVVPLVMAIGAIVSALGVAALVSQVYPLVELYAEMILLMGLAVGIDYSLFIVSRFRSERRAGWAKLDAISVASNTTGRAVFYAGITVVLSLAGLTLTRDFTFISLALGAIIVVFIAIIGSLTLLPAMLGALGENVNRLRIPFLKGEGDQAAFWGAITDRVLARPVVLATLTTAALVALAIPAFSLNLGFNAGADAIPDAVDGKRAIELLELHFSSSLIVPARIVIDAPDVEAPEILAAADTLKELIEESDAFLAPSDGRANEDRNLLHINVPVAGNIDDEESVDAVKLLRNTIIPQAFDGTDARVYVAGDTADSIDFTDRMYSSALYVFGFVLGLSFLLMLVMFRSIVIPIKAIVLNLLSVAAVYGILVMVFQWGWGISILGSEETGVIEAWLPLFLFGILFGLSMDYHMLVLNRIKEVYDETLHNERAVSTGIRLTAGQITSAALIMVGVFGAFATSRILGLQQFGLGLAVAVLIDATVIRVILLPASMKLLGDANWYLPQWLDWLPKVAPEERMLKPAQSDD